MNRKIKDGKSAAKPQNIENERTQIFFFEIITGYETYIHY
jgi:hypothetical protein